MSTSRAAPRRFGSVRAVRRLAAAAVALGVLALLPGCFTFQHTVGRGPQHAPPVVDENPRWFALWGLVPFDTTDSATLVLAGERDYRVTTKFTLWDVVWSAIPSLIGFYRQSVVVEK